MWGAHVVCRWWQIGGGAGLALCLAACSNDPRERGTTFGDGLDGGTSAASVTTGDDQGSGSLTTTESTSGISVSGPGDTGSDTSGGETGDPGCQTNADCQDDPDLGVCDPDTGACVGCTSTDDACSVGTYCDVDQKTCVPGCLEDDHCGSDLTCNTDTNTCVGCEADADCPLGTLCDAGTCEPGCSRMHGCQPGLACCSDACVDIDTDLDHCGGCESPCDPEHAQGTCDAGTCGIAMCDVGYDDCNVNPVDGCEITGICACDPDSPPQACYTGQPGTQNVGACQAGTQTCNPGGTSFGPCTGDVTPIPEICGNATDDDCDGIVDEDPDADGDGWTLCGGDCCDAVGPACLNPALVNPGAFEFGGNAVDDDCDGTIDNVLAACDAGLTSNTNSAANYARAIDLCQTTTLAPANPVDRIWGVIQSGLHLANGLGSPSALSRSIRSGFGQNIVPEFGQRLAVLSSGRAADSNDTSPSFAPFQDGQEMGTSSTFPQPWFADNGNALPNAPGCPAPAGNTAFNPVMLRLQVRVPTNAQSFSVRMYFFSAEYPEYVCTPFNDFFVALIDSSAANPADGNIAIYDDGNDLWPVGVNILDAASGLFTQCTNGSISQCGGGGSYNGCTGTAELNGTGFDTQSSTDLSCGFSGRHGGGTGWLTLSGNVTPGEVMTLRFAVWDTGDELFDSLVLLDDFQWSVQASQPGVTPG